MHAPAQARPTRLTVAAALLCLITVSCGGSGSTTPKSPASRTTAGHGYAAAYDAGWREGKRLFEDGGKGAAIREVVWGGCVRRSLTAQPRSVVEKDRGAWVLGCKQGVGSGTNRHLPTSRVTRRESDPDLLARFRSWALAHGAKQPAQHVGRVLLVHLGDRDYDVELATAYTDTSAKAEVKQLADTFATWWDGDDGDNARAWNLIVSTGNGERLITRNL
ncbi:hypothetical protein [Streptomyces sp. TLI_185]|uniref:hypothetical protein n=1 Tax=Streptomyces sp. TLI_185 TaxID=2485151 RepID=UPI000F4F879E|nr:hypothetical protein [Streptomyces sp. TLI_185]RPF34282.1 hypothetical protein EDD92_4231 [Streptomyces sp. TLI_185]